MTFTKFIFGLGLGLALGLGATWAQSVAPRSYFITPEGVVPRGTIEGDSVRQAQAAQTTLVIWPDGKAPEPPLQKVPFVRVPKEEHIFMPKGQWLVGGSLSYSAHNLSDYRFVVLENASGRGYTANFQLMAGYSVMDNMSLGFKAGYTRTRVDLASADIDLGEDLNFDISDYFTLSQMYSGTVFMRNYLSLFKSRRFALFNDLELRYGQGTGKTVNGVGESLEGMFQKVRKFEMGFCPGLIVFVANNLAFEGSAEMIGLHMTFTDQLTNQVEKGSRRKTAARFGVDIFSIKLGITGYFNGRKANVNAKYKDK